jgi:hypothetical protein
MTGEMLMMCRIDCEGGVHMNATGNDGFMREF